MKYFISLLFIGIFLLRLSGQGLMSHTASTTVSRYFEKTRGKALSVTATGAASDADLIADAINAAGFVNVVASVDASNRVIIEHNDGGEIHMHTDILASG